MFLEEAGVMWAPVFCGFKSIRFIRHFERKTQDSNFLQISFLLSYKSFPMKPNDLQWKMLMNIVLFLFISNTSLAQALGDTLISDKSESIGKKLKKYDVEISGVIQVHYLNEFNTNGDSLRDPDGFRILRARLQASGKINKFTSFQFMIDPRSPEQGGLLRDAFIDLQFLPNQKLRVGKQKTQFGWENRMSVTELYTVNRAEYSDAVARGENLRDIGIGLLGNIPLNKQWRIENDITFTNGTRHDIKTPLDFQSKKALWGRVGARYKKDNLEVNLGGSFGYGGLRYLGDSIENPNDDVYVNFWRAGVDLEVDHKYFFIASEYGLGVDMNADTLYDDPFGYHAQLAIKTKWNAGPMIRYDSAVDEFNRTTFGLYYGKPKDKLRVIINYEYRKKIIDVPEGHDDRFYVQMQLRF